MKSDYIMEKYVLAQETYAMWTTPVHGYPLKFEIAFSSMFKAGYTGTLKIWVWSMASRQI